jgi:prepilin-type N-terminal cleavage/methylation domain-containing protein
MHSLRSRRGGFTLIEIMMVVAIIGILAAIAIPSFSSYQNRSKRAEAMTHVEAIVKSEIAFFGANGVFIGTAPQPAPAPGLKVPWDAPAKADFDPLGYAPEGAVWYRYEVNTATSDCAACGVGANNEATCFTVSAASDLDGDGSVGEVVFFYTDPAGNHCDSTGWTAQLPVFDANLGRDILDRPVVVPVPAADDF